MLSGSWYNTCTHTGSTCSRIPSYTYVIIIIYKVYILTIYIQGSIYARNGALTHRGNAVPVLYTHNLNTCMVNITNYIIVYKVPMVTTLRNYHTHTSQGWQKVTTHAYWWLIKNTIHRFHTHTSTYTSKGCMHNLNTCMVNITNYIIVYKVPMVTTLRNYHTHTSQGWQKVTTHAYWWLIKNTIHRFHTHTSTYTSKGCIVEKSYSSLLNNTIHTTTHTHQRAGLQKLPTHPSNCNKYNPYTYYPPKGKYAHYA